ncbi:MAG: hypothetical protein BroJett029_14690 [Alphaproteobacteria bacterium]|nr:MAG: hypothetical protein BroJett029_14690 [Alphaproteobacteria bacterium]
MLRPGCPDNKLRAGRISVSIPERHALAPPVDAAAHGTWRSTLGWAHAVLVVGDVFGLLWQANQKTIALPPLSATPF